MSLAELQSRYGSGARLEADELELDADAAGQQRFSLPEGAAGLEVLREAAAADARLRATAPYAAERFAHARSTDLQMAHGTTTMAFIFSGGVLVAVDSRASMGSYISSGSVKKFIPISKYLVGTMAGGAADCSFWERHLAMRCRLHELREGQRISTAAASKLLRNVVYSYRGMGLSMGTMVAGWDEVGGPQLYYVDSDGTRLKGDRFSVGSGSTFAYGVLDEEYRYDMTVAEAVELGKRAIWHATHRDAYSGGCINVYCITAEGWKQYFKGDMNELYYGQYAEERKETDKKHADRKAAAAAAAAAAAGPADVEMRS